MYLCSEMHFLRGGGAIILVFSLWLLISVAGALCFAALARINMSLEL